MTTKRTPVHRDARTRITPEVVAAYAAAKEHAALYVRCIGGKTCRSKDPSRHCAECRAHIDALSELHRLLGLKPWEVSPLHAVGECRRDGTAYATSWPQALELREQLEAEVRKSE